MRGEARGVVGEIGGAVVSFETFEFTVGDRVEFRYRGLVDFLPHLLGEEHLVMLGDAAADEAEPREACPAWLMRDEAAAQVRAQRYL